MPQISVLRHKRIVDEAFDEQSDCDDVKDEQVKYILAILFHKRGVTIPSDEQPVTRRFNARLNVEGGHARYVGRCVEEILFGTFAIQSNGHKIAFVFFHHELEILVGQVIFVLEADILKLKFDFLLIFIICSV